MLEQEIIYNKERDTWNLFVNHEWYLEGSYEKCTEAMFNNSCDDEDDEYEEYDDYGYESNMPCDTYGPAACSSSCSNYARCMGWVK